MLRVVIRKRETHNGKRMSPKKENKTFQSQ